MPLERIKRNWTGEFVIRLVYTASCRICRECHVRPKWEESRVNCKAGCTSRGQNRCMPQDCPDQCEQLSIFFPPPAINGGSTSLRKDEKLAPTCFFSWLGSCLAGYCNAGYGITVVLVACPSSLSTGTFFGRLFRFVVFSSSGSLASICCLKEGRTLDKIVENIQMGMG